MLCFESELREKKFKFLERFRWFKEERIVIFEENEEVQKLHILASFHSFIYLEPRANSNSNNSFFCKNQTIWINHGKRRNESFVWIHRTCNCNFVFYLLGNVSVYWNVKRHYPWNFGCHKYQLFIVWAHVTLLLEI